jgi:septal ring factor EnvC (AmiA/AmiB activator)
MDMRSLTLGTLAVTLAVLCGCGGVYYNTMEKLGYHKREMLVDRVQEARDAQEEAKQQFQSALEEFTAVTKFQGGDLEKTYNKLKDQLGRSESKAQAVSKRINDVESVGEALFKEWESELDQYSSPDLRRLSEDKLRQTRLRYARLLGAMRSAEMKIDPVLTAFRDQVLFLKHNLNAQALASLQNELASIETDVAGLIREMEASIAEANAFIKAMNRDQK